jgi:O-antigen/teichoic acid export membrane protein
VIHFVGQALPLLLGLVTIPFIVRGLGPERFGMLSLAWAVIAYMAIFDLGLGRAATKFASEAVGKGESGAVPSVVWAAVLMQATLGVCGGLLLMATASLLVDDVLKMPPELRGEARASVYVLACSVPTFLIMGSLRGILEAVQRFDLVNLIRGPFLASYFLAPLIGLAFGLDVPGMLVLLILAADATLLAYCGCCIRLFPALRSHVVLRWGTTRKLLSFGGWMAVSVVVAPILVHLDRFMVGALISLAAVGYYAVAYELVTRLWIVPSSAVATLFPAFSALGGQREQEQMRLLLQRAVRYLLLVLGPIVALVVVFADEILGLLVGAEFARTSTGAMQILAIGVLINSMVWTPAALIQALGRPDVTAKIYLLEVPIHVILVAVMVATFGIVGAALAWTIRVALDAVALMWAVGRLGGFQVRCLFGERVRHTVILLIAFSACAWSIGMFLRPTLAQLGGVGLMLIGSGWVVWRYLIDGNERRHVESLVEAAGAALRRE